MAGKKNGKTAMIAERQPDSRDAALFGQIRQKLGSPLLPRMFERFSGIPGFLGLHWAMVEPLLQTEEFYHCADRVRAQAYTWVHNYFSIPDLCDRLGEEHFSPGAKEELTAVVDLFYFLDSLLLLLAGVQAQAFEGPVGKAVANLRPGEPPRFSVQPTLLGEELASAPLRRTFDEIKHVLRISAVPQDFEAMARWQPFLAAFWLVMKEIAASPLYEQFHLGLQSHALAIAQEVPLRLEMPPQQLEAAGLDEEKITAAMRATDQQVRHLAAGALCIAVAKIGLEHGNENVERAA